MSAPSLSRLLDADRAPDAIVAWRDTPLRWRDFRGAVANLTRRLGALPPGRVALHTTDSYAFAVGLLAIWQTRRIAVCPPNARPEGLSALSDLVIAAVGDGPAAVPRRPLLSPEPDGRGGELSADPLAADALAVELFTSGTTGRGKAVPKTIFQLEHEVARLDAQLGAALGDATVFGSASHQHLYGMLFRVLWPLAVGRPFLARAPLHAQELLAQLRGHAPGALVSVPAHLKRLAEQEGFDALAKHCREVFSSGGPLAPDTAARWGDAVGRAPLEVFGSTETGGVGFRRQGRGRAGAAWTPFDGVRVAGDADGRLRVHSRIASLGEQRSGFAMGDRVQLLADGRFRLQGRADRVLKIGEKRLSLPDMEERLREHALVEGTALLPLSRGGELRVAAVVVPSRQGRCLLEAGGRRALAARLRAALSREWDPVLLPRAWRFVPALPEDAQGKVTVRLLRELFDAGQAGGAA